jgi:hypothetical protein
MSAANPSSPAPSPSGADYDVVVIGGTPAGIVLAVRAAREGARVLLVHHTPHLGGMLANGLGVWDSRYERMRSPIYDEVRQAIFAHYRNTYGLDSPQYGDALPGATGHTNGKFEPRVAEQVLTALVAREKRITVVLSHYPAAVERVGSRIVDITFASMNGLGRFRASAPVFAECSYEADTLPLAGIPYRVGREARSEYGEDHAGVVFMQPAEEAPNAGMARTAADQAALQLRHFPGFQVRRPESTGEGDGNVQAMNYRVILTNEPARRVPIQPPMNYDPARLRELEFGAEIDAIPNGKLGLNRPQLLGPHNDYVEGDWSTRRRVMDLHWETAMGLLWFRQHDQSVPEAERRRWLEYGLACDEFSDHHHRPHEIYLREGRRLVGRTLLTQADTVPALGLGRPLLHRDSIAFTEWYVDSHACTPRRVAGSLEEGKIMLHQETFPGQVPFRALLPTGVDNLLVPVSLSATHVAWNTVRLEATWMHIAEAAAYAALQALQHEQAPALIDGDRLRQTLAARGITLAFFNDLDSAPGDEMAAAAQYFSGWGFFPDFDARLAAPLDGGTAREWLAALRGGAPAEPNAVARRIALACARGEAPVRRTEFAALLPEVELAAGLEGTLTRGEGLGALWQFLSSSRDNANPPSRGITSSPSTPAPATDSTHVH